MRTRNMTGCLKRQTSGSARNWPSSRSISTRKHVDLAKEESFGFLGFEFRGIRSLQGKWRPYYSPKLKQRTALLRKLILTMQLGPL
jgi:hypothetical protein